MDPTAALSQPEEASLLTKLPVDILHVICAQLCPHCCGVDGYHLNKDVRTGLVALRSLLKTCKALRAVAWPYLFHRLQLPEAFYSVDFLQTLANRPDLASRVKVMYQGDCLPHPWPKDEAALMDLVQSLHMDVPMETELSEEELLRHNEEGDFSYWDRQDRLDFLADLERDSLPNVLSETLIALLPNLETLSVRSGLYHGYRRNRRLAKRFSMLGQTSGLSQLRVLRLEAESGGSFRLFSPGNAVLMNAAPRLERLVLTHCDGLWCPLGDANMYQALPNLRALDMERCELEDKQGKEVSHLQTLVKMSPNLEAFRFAYFPINKDEKNKRHLSSASILAGLEPRKEGLRYLDIDLSCLAKGQRFPIVEPSLDVDSLQGFSRIETLKLSDKSFCQCTTPVGMTDHEHGSLCLVNLIKPVSQTLKVLVVRVGRQSPAWSDIAKLGGHVVAGRFPKFQRLEVHPIFTEQPHEKGEELEAYTSKWNELVLGSFGGSTIPVLIREPDVVWVDQY